jgi:DNA-binding NtrC family response regulator
MHIWWDGWVVMSHRVLVFEGASSWFRDQFSASFDFHFEWANWSTTSDRGIGERHADLIVFVAEPKCPLVSDCFRYLASHPLRMPTLAILPADDDLMHIATEAVDDFVIAPFLQSELQSRVSRLLYAVSGESNNAAAHEQLTQKLGLTELVGEHPAFLQVIAQIPVVAQHNSTALILGETGTGKELFARAIHHMSPRRHLPFIAVDCAAVPEHLFENEMFGHARGAFTDAHRDQKGLVALAGDGTLFLDEIDSLPIAAQSKLLRLLQERTYRAVGSERFVQTKVKIVAASNQDIGKLVEEKKFRSDLFFRLNVFRLQLPPLRERRSDIGLLARHFLNSIAEEHGTPRKTLSPKAIQRLMTYDWPGNVRELYNVLHRAAAFSTGTQLNPELPASSRLHVTSDNNFREARARVVAAFEKDFLEEMLRRASGNVTQAAQLAGKDRRVFGRMMKRHNIRHSVA